MARSNSEYLLISYKINIIKVSIKLYDHEIIIENILFVRAFVYSSLFTNIKPTSLYFILTYILCHLLWFVCIFQSVHDFFSFLPAGHWVCLIDSRTTITQKTKITLLTLQKAKLFLNFCFIDMTLFIHRLKNIFLFVLRKPGRLISGRINNKTVDIS